MIIAGVTNDIFSAEGKHSVTVHIITNKFSGIMKANEPEKCDTWKWISLENLPENMFISATNFLKDNKDLIKILTK